MTVAIAFIDHFFWQEETYFHRKAAVWLALTEFLQTKLHDLDSVNVKINTLDREGHEVTAIDEVVHGRLVGELHPVVTAGVEPAVGADDPRRR